MTKLQIHGLGYFHPENVIDNRFLEELDIGTNDEWITERVGIKTRRTVLPLDYIKTTRNQDPRASTEAALYSNADTGKRAAEMAINDAGISPEKIGMIIVGGCSPEHATPAEASTIAEALGLSVPAIDMQTACSTFGMHMHMLSTMQADALPDFILTVIPENNTRTIDFNDRKAAVLWGDGTHASVLSTRIPGKASVSHTTLASDPANWHKVVIPRYQHFQQDGSAVQSFAIKRSVKCYRELAQQLPDYASNTPYAIFHQANVAMLKSVCKRCEISTEKHLFNGDNFGNTGAAGAPTVLSQNWARFVSGDRIIMAVVGAGLTWSSLLVEVN